MSTLEKEIIEKFRQLSPESRMRMLSSLQEEMVTYPTNLTAWLAETDVVRLTLRPDTNGYVPSASELVNDVREEHDADILRSPGLRDSSGDRTN